MPFGSERPQNDKERLLWWESKSLSLDGAVSRNLRVQIYQWPNRSCTETRIRATNGTSRLPNRPAVAALESWTRTLGTRIAIRYHFAVTNRCSRIMKLPTFWPSSLRAILSFKHLLCLTCIYSRSHPTSVISSSPQQPSSASHHHFELHQSFLLPFGFINS